MIGSKMGMQVIRALGLRFDPAPAYKFYVELTGVIVGEFLQCGGLSMQREVFEYAEGGVNDYVHQLPGRNRYGRITLKHGITYSRELWRWYRTGLYDGNVLRVNMSIILGNAEGKKAKHWDVYEAYPVRWVGPDLDTSSKQVAVETIEIAHSGLSLSFIVGTPMGGATGAIGGLLK